MKWPNSYTFPTAAEHTVDYAVDAERSLYITFFMAGTATVQFTGVEREDILPAVMEITRGDRVDFYFEAGGPPARYGVGFVFVRYTKYGLETL